VTDALELTPEALGALELDERRRWDALAQLLELEALEHPVSRYDPAADGARRAAARSAGELEARLAVAERVCELVDVLELRVSRTNQPHVDAIYRALEEWRRLRGEPCPAP